MVQTAEVTEQATTRPAFGGYVLVAAVVAWLAGIALRAIEPLAALEPVLWGALAAICLLVAWGVWLISRRVTAGHGSPSATRYLLVAGFLACCLFLGATRAAAADPFREGAALVALATGGEVQLRGEVAAEPDIRAGFRYLDVAATAASRDQGHTWQPVTGRVEAAVPGPDDWFAPAYGDTVVLTGKLQPLDGSYAPAGVVARMSGGVRARIEARGGGNFIQARLFELRVGLAEALQRALPEPEAALLIGILLGLKTPMLRARLALFTSTGTIHLVVPAGLKVSVLAELAGRALQPLGRWVRLSGAMFAVGAYAALGGGGPAAVRAAIMGALLVLAPALGRSYNIYTALALAAFIMTAVEPLLIYDAGFQLTVLATLSLPLFVPSVTRALTILLGPLTRLPGVAVAAQLVAVTIAAQLGTLPILALTFHQISLVAPLANLLTVPLLAPLLMLGSALAASGLLVSGLGGLLSLALTWLTWPLLWYADGAIALCAALPGAALPVGDTAVVFAWGYYVLLGALRWGIPRLRHGSGQPDVAASPHPRAAKHGQLGRGALAGLLALSLLAGCGAAVPALAAGRAARLTFLDVGAGGEATLLQLPSGVTVLLNGGPSGTALEAALAGRLPFWQRSLDLAILTDPRAGDARGLEDAASHFRIARAADSGMLHPTTEYLAWRDAMTRAGAAYTQVRQGNVITLDATTTLRVLAPPQQLYPSGEGGTTASNDAILRLETPGLRALFLGSADGYALDALTGSGEDLRADVVELALVPGAQMDLSGPLGAVLARAQPRLIVVGDAPVAPNSAAALKAVAQSWDTDAEVAAATGALIYRTSQAGTIELRGDAGGWSLG